MKQSGKANKKNSPPKKLYSDASQNSNPNDDISKDFEYKLLIEESQHGHWEECERLIISLDVKYPNNTKLIEFKSDFEVQYKIIKNTNKSVERENKGAIIRFAKILVIIGGTLFVVFSIIWFGSKLLQLNIQNQLLQNEENQINTLSSQAEILLDSGQPDKALEIVQKMKAINATNPKVIDLTKRTAELFKIDEQYKEGVAKLQNGLFTETLTILTKIENEFPGYKDVPQLIEKTTSDIEKSQTYNEGVNAYNSRSWQAAIDDFEKVLTLDPDYSALNIKDMLLNSYLHQIIILLEGDNTTSADIDQAEIYYRRASSMVPQSKVYALERQSLQKLSIDLLQQKYTQAALNIINDPAQTAGQVQRAVTYMRNVASFDPTNEGFQTALNKITLYYSGFQAYLTMNWQSAIDHLSTLVMLDENYAGGFANQLLYEAHVQKGSIYFSRGLYMDSRLEYEAAENLIYGKDDLMNLYLVETSLGRTLGKLQNYKDAASYFKYAVETMNYSQRAQASPGFVEKVTEAIKLFNEGKFEDSYNLFDQTLVDNQPIYIEKEVDGQQGSCLALIAAQNQSSVIAIVTRNNLSNQTILVSTQKLIIPWLPK